MGRKMMRVPAKQRYHRLILHEFRSGRARVLSDEEARFGYRQAYLGRSTLLRLYIQKHRKKKNRL